MRLKLNRSICRRHRARCVTITRPAAFSICREISATFGWLFLRNSGIDPVTYGGRRRRRRNWMVNWSAFQFKRTFAPYKGTAGITRVFIYSMAFWARSLLGEDKWKERLISILIIYSQFHLKYTTSQCFVLKTKNFRYGISL